jgi:4-amino-4-deoxy-L-arabinose transferase-like glycosyltransferase
MRKESNSKIDYLRLIAIVSITLLTRLFLLYVTSAAHQGDLSVLIRTDETRYIKEASIILNNGIILLWDVPLYPMLLAGLFKIFGSSYLCASILNIILFSLTTGILYLTIAYFFNEARASITATITILFPTLYMNILRPTAEALYLFLISLAFYTFLSYLKHEKKAYGILTAIILSLLTLTKETFAFFPIIISAIILIKYLPDFRRTSKKILLITLVYILTLSPMLLYNYQTSGNFNLSKKMAGVIAVFPKDLDSINKDSRLLLKKYSPVANVKNFLWERKRFFLGTGTFSLLHAFGYETNKLRKVANSPKDYFSMLKEYGSGWPIFQYSALSFLICVFISGFLAMLMLLLKRRLGEALSLILIFSYFLLAYSCRYNSRYFIILVPFLAFLTSYFYSVLYYYIRDKIKRPDKLMQ